MYRQRELIVPWRKDLAHAVRAEPDRIARRHGPGATRKARRRVLRLGHHAARALGRVHHEHLVHEKALFHHDLLHVRPARNHHPWDRPMVVLALLGESRSCSRLIVRGGALVPLDPTIGCVAVFHPAHGPVGVVPVPHRGMPRETPRLVLFEHGAVHFVRPAAAPALVLVRPFLGAQLARLEVVKHHEPRIGAQLLTAVLALHRPRKERPQE